MSEYSEISYLLHDHELVLFNKIWGYWSISPKNLRILVNIPKKSGDIDQYPLIKTLYEGVQSSDGYLFFFPLQCQ